MTLSCFHIASGRKIKIMYSSLPEHMLHLVVAQDRDGKRIVATFMTDGQVQVVGHKDTGTVVHEVVTGRDFTYIIVLDHWLEGPIIIVRDREAYKLLIESFLKLGFKITQSFKNPNYEYVILERM